MPKKQRKSSGGQRGGDGEKAAWPLSRVANLGPGRTVSDDTERTPSPARHGPARHEAAAPRGRDAPCAGREGRRAAWRRAPPPRLQATVRPRRRPRAADRPRAVGLRWAFDGHRQGAFGLRGDVREDGSLGSRLLAREESHLRSRQSCPW